MRFPRFSCLALLFVACASTSPTVATLEDRYNKARLSGDAKTLTALLDDSWTMVHVDGRVESKQSYVDGIATGARQIQAIDVRDRDIRIFGDVAVVTGTTAQRGLRRGELRSGTFRFTHVWVRGRMVAAQSTEIVGEQPSRPL